METNPTIPLDNNHIQAPNAIGNYRIEYLLGSGGMADVYLATHLLLNQKFAIKVMKPSLSINDPIMAKRFVREAQLAQKLNHPNIVRVFDVGNDPNTRLLSNVMEYVEGKNFSDYSREKSISPQLLRQIANEMAQALIALNQLGIVHRDIKPSNIMLCNDGTIKLMDFGIAKIPHKGEAGEATLTMDQTVLGTPAFISPEQCQDSKAIDTRSDIYSLGVSLYSIASGQSPFRGKTPMEILYKVIQETPRPLAEIRPDLDPKLIKLIESMMEKSPENRPQSPQELLNMLDTGKIPIKWKKLSKPLPVTVALMMLLIILIMCIGIARNKSSSVNPQSNDSQTKQENTSSVVDQSQLAANTGVNENQHTPQHTAETEKVEQNTEPVLLQQSIQNASETKKVEQNTVPVLLLHEFLSKKGITPGYDKDKNRIIVVDKANFKVSDPKNLTEQDLTNRSISMSKLLMSLKAQVVQNIFSEMSIERIIEIPDNPIKKTITKELEQVNEELAVAVKSLANLDEELAVEINHNYLLTVTEKLQSIKTWFAKTANDDFINKLPDGNKTSFDKAKEAFEKANDIYQAALAKAKTLNGTLTETSTEIVSLNSSMVLRGGTLLKQAEGFVNEKGTTYYQIAAIYCWSPEMRNAADKILQGYSVTFKPGKKTVEQWIMQNVKNGNLATWVGPRNFIDNKGNMWYIGIASAPTNRNPQMARSMTELRATQEVVNSLHSDFVVQKVMQETVKKTLSPQRSSFSHDSESFSHNSESYRNYFSNVIFSGVALLFNETIAHPYSNQKLQVCVAGLNSGVIANLKEMKPSITSPDTEINNSQDIQKESPKIHFDINFVDDDFFDDDEEL